MKKNSLIAAVFLIAVVACKSKKEVAVSPGMPGDSQLSAAKARFPDVTMEQLRQGHTIFYGACTNCHGAKNITGYTEQELSGVMDKMAPKANLTQQEKDAVWKYAIAMRLTVK